MAKKKITGENLLFTMEKTACYGACPSYSVNVNRSGYGLFTGKEHVELTGTYRFRLCRKEIEKVILDFEKAGFFSLQDRYYETVTDLPTTYISFYSGGKQKKIMDYYGAPESLKQLEASIEALVFSKKMKKLAEPAL